MTIIDISLPLDSYIPVYPGNVPLVVETHHSMPSHATHLSKITMGSHTGTHIDAPSHALARGLTLDQIPLEKFIGEARVLNFTRSVGAIKKEDLAQKDIQPGERILAKTSNSERGFSRFYDDYVYLDGDAADYLAEIGIALFGIDYLSVKQKGSADHRPHVSLLSKNIPIVEGLNLKDVEEGKYELVVLPLRFIGIEGGPARAILRR